MLNRITGGRSRRDDGFTLIELLVVVVILGILSAVVVFAVRGTGDRGAAAAYATDAKTIRTAQEAFCAKFGRYGEEAELVSQGFLSEPSDYHDVTFSSGGPCGGSSPDPAIAGKSAFAVECRVAAGCGGGGAQPRGGTLVLPLGDVGTLNSSGLNPAITSQGGVHTASELFFNGLLAWSADNQIVPDLAASLPAVQTSQLPEGVGQRVTVNLRPDVQFHRTAYFTPTRPLQAQDVQFTFDKALLPWHGRTAASLTPAICNGTQPGLTGAECGGRPGIEYGPGGPTGLQVIFNFKYAYGPLLNQLNVTEAPILSKEWYESCDFNSTAAAANCPNDQLFRPIGTGPFEFKSYNRVDKLEAVRHGEYFRGPRLPYFDGVNQVVVPNAATALVNGDIDTTGLSGSQQRQSSVQNAIANRTVSLVRGIPRGPGGGNCITTLGFNLWNRGDATTGTRGTPANIKNGIADLHPILGEDSGPYGLDPNGAGSEVRRAIAHALNRQVVFDQVQFGEGRIARYPIDSRITWAHPNPADLTPAFNTTTANLLLDQAGWGDEPRVTIDGVANIRTKNGRPLRLEIVTPPKGTTPGQHDYGTIAKDQLAGVGIFVDHTDTFPPGDKQAARVFTKRAFDISIASYCNGDDPEIGVRRQIDPDNVKETEFSNMAGYRDPAMADLLNTAVQGATLAARGATYQQIQEKLAAEMPYIWVVESESTRGVRSACTGFNFMNTGLFMEGGSCRR